MSAHQGKIITTEEVAVTDAKYVEVFEAA